MGGTIEVFSQLGEGTTFEFEVRLQAGVMVTGNGRDPGGMHAPANEALPNMFASRQACVLVADDNNTNQLVALGILKKFGVRADAVANGAEALDALSTIPYDLVLMDVQMPVMDGLEATRRLREEESGQTPRGDRLPIIAMTASAMHSDREKCLKAGMDDFVSKPVMPQDLARALAKWLPNLGRRGETSSAGNDPSLDSEPASSIFDMSALRNRMMGDRELTNAVLDDFLEDMPRQIQSLMKFVEAGAGQDIGNAGAQNKRLVLQRRRQGLVCVSL